MNNYARRMFLLWPAVGVLLFFQQADAQFERLYESWRWAHFTTTSGLPSNIVESVIEADDSTVWVSTAKGIAWYDGYRWIPVIVDSLFPQQRVRIISKYNKGKMFVVLFGSLYIGSAVQDKLS